MIQEKKLRYINYLLLLLLLLFNFSCVSNKSNIRVMSFNMIPFLYSIRTLVMAVIKAAKRVQILFFFSSKNWLIQRAVILTGDFNFTRNTDAYNVLSTGYKGIPGLVDIGFTLMLTKIGLPL